MGKIWSIYQKDIKNVFKDRKVALLIIGVMLLPSVYAWVNIKAVWDPYSNTEGIKIAVTNEDEGGEIQEKVVNVGKETVQNLKRSKNLGWVFVNRKEAERGVKYGNYYAYLIIPKDFSKKLSSILEKNPEQPVIEFAVNEKINPVATKIASSGGSGITAQISQSFIKSVGEALFTAFNNAGVELQQELPFIQNAEKRILELEKAMPQIEEMGNKAIELEKKLPEIREKAQKVMELQKRINDIQKLSASILKVEAGLPLIEESADNVSVLKDQITDIQDIPAIMEEVEKNLSFIEANIQQAIDNAETSNDKSAETTGNWGQLAGEQEELVKIHDSLQAIRKDLQKKSDQVVQGIGTAEDLVETDLPTVKQKISKAADFVKNDLPKLEEDIRKASDLVQAKYPVFEDTVYKLASLARNDLPGLKAGVSKAANQIRKFQENVNLENLISFLKHDPDKESSFLAEPVKMETKRIFPIPNYGSSMTPLYTMLALWVGGIMLISSLPVNVKNQDGIFRNYHIYYGRLITFLTIGIFQALIVSLGNLFLLDVYVVNKLMFVMLAIFISLVFVTITYTLRSLFGNIGSGVAMIFLVLQISSSGATFPVSMTSPFFQALSPFMPFTYAVTLLREAIGGMLLEIVVKSVLALSVFILVCFGMALLLKRSLSKDIRMNSGD